MAVYKCKMCGGELQVGEDRVAFCGYCGTRQTLPRLDSSEKENLYDRASHFRRNNEFDKATAVYEQILTLDSTDAESYWSLVLCRYGIEYVEDPDTGRRIPTVNRAQFTSVYDDDNYKCAVNYADPLSRSVYEDEARVINEIQKGILAISQNEQPFDVFICYKETDASGRRTHDSVLAAELYHELTREGFRVFFAKITLEDKLGTAYEPYIFAALNSSKVMVVLGTKAEHFNAVWVKNEWSRFLALIKNGEKKILIPAYKNMDPYDLPEEFSHLQAQDMNKLGFMQDIIRGIKKIAQPEERNIGASLGIQPQNVNTAANTAPLIKRAYMFLEDGDWESADEYCEKVLDIDPENAGAYLGKLMADLRVKKQDELKNCKEPFDGNNNFQKALRFGDGNLKAFLEESIVYIRERNENERLERIYLAAKAKMGSAVTENDYREAIKLFATAQGFKDSDVLKMHCLDNAENARINEILESAENRIQTGIISDIERAIKSLEAIKGNKKADAMTVYCRKRIAEIEKEEENHRTERLKQEKKERIRNTLLCAVIVFVLLGSLIGASLYENSIRPAIAYKQATELMEDGEYFAAAAAFEALDGYKDSEEMLIQARKLYRKDSVQKSIEALADADIGDIISFGGYEQDGNTDNGQEEISWLVLDKKDGKILVISRYGLDWQPYNKTKEDVTWEDCTLRQWLNDEFLNTAFFEEEQERIARVTVAADENPSYSSDPGKATKDKVFLLSIEEAEKYFDSDAERVCHVTEYAKTAVVNNAGACWWWLRSPGSSQTEAAEVMVDGGVRESGYCVNYMRNCIRPAMWITLDS